MRKPLRQFSDAIRASIFADGKGTCAFCGHSLWILDWGISPFTDQDWADHIKPASRRGKSLRDNGTCACSKCNSKKSNNSRDKVFLLTQFGRPSYFGHLWTRSRIDERLADQLDRLSQLQPVDWYFNRAVTDSLWHMHNVFEGANRKRKKRVWFGAAWNFLCKWHKQMEKLKHENRQPASFEKRGLVLRAQRPDIRLILALRKAPTKKKVFEILDELNLFFQGSNTAWSDFIGSLTLNGKRRIYSKARRNRYVTLSTREAMRQYLAVYAKHPGLLPTRTDEESSWWT